jgi:hypothetical protein
MSIISRTAFGMGFSHFFTLTPGYEYQWIDGLVFRTYTGSIRLSPTVEDVCPKNRGDLTCKSGNFHGWFGPEDQLGDARNTSRFLTGWT